MIMRTTFKKVLTCAKVTVICAGMLGSSVSFAADLCSPDESVIFSCQLKENKKIVSVCSSKAVSKDQGYIQYRYGTLGKIELSYPSTKVHSQSYFGYDYYSRPDLTSLVFGFNIGTYRYEISESTEGGQDSGSVTDKLLVSSDKSKRSLDATCIGDANSTSDLSKVMDIVPCDKKHVFVDGGCD